MARYEYTPSIDRLRAAIVALETAIDALDMQDDVDAAFAILARVQEQLRQAEKSALATMQKLNGG